jgi:hypothetical protein
MKTVADQFAETLAAAGVKRIYGIVGDNLNGLPTRRDDIEWDSPFDVGMTGLIGFPPWRKRQAYAGSGSRIRLAPTRASPTRCEPAQPVDISEAVSKFREN